MKVCTRCGKTKDETAFLKSDSVRGRTPDCRDCRNKYNREYRKHRRDTDEEYRRKCIKSIWPWRRRKKYNLTPEQVDQMLKDQNGACKCCGGINQDGRPLFIDHDHTTNKVRGLLCKDCNSALGWARDSSQLLRALADYLDGYSQVM